jgi:glutamate:Na+ symporter, ESS family
MAMFAFDLIQTLAFAAAVLFIGYGIRDFIKPLARYNIPAPVIGGLGVAVVLWITRSPDQMLFTFDTTLQSPLMIAFFTSIGFGASLSLLRVGGPQVLMLFGIATVFAILQNVIGVAIALPFGIDPLFGVMAGSVTLTGGPATGLAFAPEFEAAGLQGAATIAVASGMAGIVAGGLAGGPLGTRLIEKLKLRTARGPIAVEGGSAADVVEEKVGAAVEPHSTLPPEGEDQGAYLMLKAVTAILIAMWIGGLISAWVKSKGITLPSYIGGMIIAAVIRNVDDVTGLFKLPERTIDDVGNVALSLFLVMALMTLKLWELAGLALPLIVILIAQVAAVAAFSFWFLFRMMGRDYDAAVMSGGFVGFMLGTTANAMANMRSLVERYGPAPRAFLVVPMVGAFFIDFTNAIIITIGLNFLR